jgi:putative iron-dependent peroxidase
MCPEPQAVLEPPTRAAMVLILTVNPAADGPARLREFAADLPGLVRAVGFREPDAGLSCVIGFGAQVWPKLFGTPPPAALHPFRSIRGVRQDAVATPGDVLLHLRAAQADLCFELAAQVLTQLEGTVTAVLEVQGFRYFDSRDLLGFVDGSENPTGTAAEAAAVIGEDDPDFAGGSYVLVQTYLHDLPGWKALDVSEQERIVGRAKLSNVELDDAEIPGSAHRLLTTISDADGTEHKIIHDKMPFGSPAAGEFGTLFIGYARSPDVLEQMLRRMFVGVPPDGPDRILDFSRAVTGSLYFVPSVPLLERLADSPPVAKAPANGSLRIGSLRGETQ